MERRLLIEDLKRKNEETLKFLKELSEMLQIDGQGTKQKAKKKINEFLAESDKANYYAQNTCGDRLQLMKVEKGHISSGRGVYVHNGTLDNYIFALFGGRDYMFVKGEKEFDEIVERLLKVKDSDRHF